MFSRILSRSITSVPVFCTILILSLLWTSQTAAKDTLTIGLLPEMNVFKQKQRFTPLARHLSDKIGMKVELTMLSRYGNIIDRLKEAKVDAAFLGSFTGALAISQLNVDFLARPINMDGTSTYFGHIFVRKDSNIKNIADMKGKTLALVERATTAGYVFPRAYFNRYGITDMDSYFSEYYFAGSHDAAIDAVLTGQADIGAAKNTVYDRFMEANPAMKDELVILASSPRVPSNGLCIIPGVHDDVKEKIKETLLNLHNDPAGADVLKALGAKRFVKTTKEDYKPVHDMAVEAGIDMGNYQYYNP